MKICLDQDHFRGQFINSLSEKYQSGVNSNLMDVTEWQRNQIRPKFKSEFWANFEPSLAIIKHWENL